MQPPALTSRRRRSDRFGNASRSVHCATDVFWRVLFTVVLLTGSSGGYVAAGMTPLEVRNTTPWVWPLLEHLEILEDPQSRLDLAYVCSGDAANSFSPATAGKLHPTSTYWFRVQVVSKDEVPTLYALTAPADCFELYRVREGHAITLGTNGYAIPVEQRATRGLWYPSVVAALVPNEPTWLYIKKKPGEPVTAMLFEDSGGAPGPESYQLLSYLGAVELRASLWHLLGLFYGLVAAIAVVNLALFLLARNPLHILCGLFTVSVGLFLYCLDGFGVYFLYPAAPRFMATLDLIGAISLATGTLFIGKFTNSADIAPRLTRIAWLNVGMLLAITIVMLTLFLAGAASTGVLRYFHYYPAQVHYFLGIVLGMVWLVIACRLGQRSAWLLLCGMSVLCLNTLLWVIAVTAMPGVLQYLRTGWYIGVSVLIVCITFGVAYDARRMAREVREAQQLQLEAQRNMIDSQKRLLVAFARFVPGDFLRCLGKSDITEVQLGDAVEARMTILFSDIRLFSSLTEAMSPAQSFAFLNQYLGEIGPIIRKHNGFIDKYIGDAVMALFPGRIADAVAASIEMVHVARAFQHQVNGTPTSGVGIGVGIHAGPLMLGTIGEAERMDPTVISDAVNTTARLESLTKVLGANVLCTGPIADALRGVDESERRFLGAFELKGKRELITVVEVLAADRENMRQLKKETREDFEHAVKMFQRGNHAGAKELFQRVLATNPNDGPTRYYLERCGPLT